MNKNEIKETWNLPDAWMRRVAISEALKQLPDSLPALVDMFEECPDDKADELVIALNAALPFLKEGFDSSPTLLYHQQATYNGQAITTFTELYDLYYRFIDCIVKKGSEKLIRKCNHYFGGLHPDLAALYPEYDLKPSPLCTSEQQACEHQLMVFVTGVCNLKCSYCFSNDIERQHISEQNLERIFNWAAKNNCKVVTPCGGEPLLYPHIGRFLDLIHEHGMQTYFASNCTIPLKQFTQKQISTIKLITFHITEALWKHDEMMKTFCENIEFAKKAGIEIIARANFFKPDIDVTPWFSIINKYKIGRLNIALTIPSGTKDNAFIDSRMFSDYIPVVTKCIEECRRHNVSISFAKPIPPCVLSKEWAMEMLRFNNFFPLCNIHEDGCMKNVCLSPDMKFKPCLGVSTPAISFDERLTWGDLSNLIKPTIEAALKKELFDKCGSCFLHARHLCQGACLSYKYL